MCFIQTFCFDFFIQLTVAEFPSCHHTLALTHTLRRNQNLSCQKVLGGKEEDLSTPLVPSEGQS